MTPDVDSLERRVAGYLRHWKTKANLAQKGKPAIIILHDCSDVTANHLGELVSYLRNSGFVLIHFDPAQIRDDPQYYEWNSE